MILYRINRSWIDESVSLIRITKKTANEKSGVSNPFPSHLIRKKEKMKDKLMNERRTLALTP